MRLLALAGLLVALLAPVGDALASPPGPPPLPPTIGPPPLPPTPVPTVAPTVVAPQPEVDVSLSAAKVTRGQTQKVEVSASTDDKVQVIVQYHTGKPVTYLTKIGSTGQLSKKWTVPKSAPVGKATVRVVVQTDLGPVSKSFTFLVVK